MTEKQEKVIAQIEDALGDILYHLFKLAIAYKINLADAFEKALTDIKDRYGKS